MVISEPVRTDPHTRTTVERATVAWSVLVTVAGLWWLVDPGAYPLRADEAGMSLVTWLPARTAALLLIAWGLVGTATAAALLREPCRSPGPQRAMVGVAATQVLVFAVVVPDTRILIAMGYLSALAGPLLVLGVLVAGARRSAVARAALVVLLGAAAVVGWVAGVGPDTLPDLGGELAGGFARNGPGIVAVTGAFTGGALWLVTLVRFLRRRRQRCVSCGRPAAAWTRPEAVQRWGRRVTIAAALCPLPYALLRMTWLTPWPQGIDPDLLADAPEFRIFGLGLGFAALAGSLLTLGLIQRWGERFPGWLPVLRGRPVPAAGPTLAALLVAGAITVAGRSMAQSLLASGELEMPVGEALLIFPFPVWGPLLAAAAVAYYLRRRGRCPRCEQL